jgi:hypothetical protein
MPDDGTGARLSDARNLLGLVVAGFAGVLNFIGLKSAEVGVVLRNEPSRVSIVGILLLLGVVTAALSIFVAASHSVYPGWMIGFAVLAVSAFPAVIWAIPSPFPGQGGEDNAAFWVAVACWGAAAVLLGWSAWWAPAHHGEAERPKRDSLQDNYSDLFNLQALLLAVALILTSAAAYGALRMETISQNSPLAQVGDSLTINGSQDDLTISISASKMSDLEWLGVDVRAAPRSWHIETMCGEIKQTRGALCAEDPCYYFRQLQRACIQLSEDVLPPDASGTVQRNVVVPFSPQQFQHVQITAVVCEPKTSKKYPPGSCQPLADAVNSRLDVAVPPPAAAATSH